MMQNYGRGMRGGQKVCGTDGETYTQSCATQKIFACGSEGENDFWHPGKCQECTEENVCPMKVMMEKKEEMMQNNKRFPKRNNKRFPNTMKNVWMEKKKKAV